jgi:hypothetical protein
MSIHKQQATAALLAATFLLGCLSFASLAARPQQRDRSITANQQNEQSHVPEPVMRIALSTNTRAATISTAAQLLNASDLIGEPQPLESSRVRVESRALSPQDLHDQDVEVLLARALTREDADRLISAVREVADEEATAVVDSGDRWRVVVVKQSLEDGEAAISKLEAAGFDATLSSGKTNENTKPSDSNGLTSGAASRPRATTSSSASTGTAPARTNCLRRWAFAAAFQRTFDFRFERREERAGSIQRQTVPRAN